MAKRKRKSKKFYGVKVDRLAAGIGGALVAKGVNVPLGKLLKRYMPQNDPMTPGREGRIGRLIISGTKIGAGVLAQKSKSQLIQDAGYGAIIVGGMEAVDELIPSMDLSGVGMFDDYEEVGNVVEVDLDQINGNDFDKRLEAYQDVAGMSDEYIDDEMELAGYDEYAYAY